MIIEAKASQPQKMEPPDPRKKLEFNLPERVTQLPVYLALIFTGIAAYIKSAFPALAHEHAPASAETNRATNVGTTHSPGSESAGPGVDPLATRGTEQDQDNGAPQHTAQPWDAGFTMPDPIAFHYTAPAFDFLGPHVAPFFPAAVHYQPQNDNTAYPVSALDEVVSAARPNPAPWAHQPPQADSSTETLGNPDNDDTSDGNDHTPSPTNRAPTVLGPVRLKDVFAGQVVVVGLTQLLFGAADPDNDALTVNDLTATGGILVRAGDGWSLATSHGTLGTITFTYEVSDGVLATTQHATLNVLRHQMQLSPHDDVQVGTPWDDDINALAGNDIVDARAGDDSVVAGPGDDRINGGDGDDQLFGNNGNDIIFGGAGNDIIGGGDGDDQLYGDDGNDIIAGDAGGDTLSGDAGDDVLRAGAGDDRADGGAGDDVINGDEGNDLLLGGGGHDTIMGDEGDDTLNGDAGADRLYGGSGDDTLHGGDDDDVLSGGDGDDDIHGDKGNDRFMGDAGRDRMDGGEGHDVIDYSNFTADIHLDLAAGTACSDEIDEDFFDNIEEFIGGHGNDTFVFGQMAATVAGGGGDDLFIFTLSDSKPQLSHQLVFDILDFVVGDRIHMADYEISQRADRLEEERFGDIYDALDGGGDGALPIRVSYAHYDDMDHTIIEADVDRDDFYEISITLDGVQLPLTIGNHIA